MNRNLLRNKLPNRVRQGIKFSHKADCNGRLVIAHLTQEYVFSWSHVQLPFLFITCLFVFHYQGSMKGLKELLLGCLSVRQPGRLRKTPVNSIRSSTALQSSVTTTEVKTVSRPLTGGSEPSVQRCSTGLNPKFHQPYEKLVSGCRAADESSDPELVLGQILCWRMAVPNCCNWLLKEADWTRRRAPGRSRPPWWLVTSVTLWWDEHLLTPSWGAPVLWSRLLICMQGHEHVCVQSLRAKHKS